ncbi:MULTISPECIES: hypothetical protein [Streptomyces]|uniref:Uncharacterized protein n=1 Tax=Streptomyces xanthii TaxID=2768069 RepID=A0A7H1B122_9ACTN|nr:hypothetical protein [Streptomyces xanthii]QNS02427.1 hypothetical protein IAG42_01555 [Streptomyces xanthii]
MRTRAATHSATPIYDALVAHWQALGREVPGRPDATGTRRGEPADLFGRG